MMKPKSIASVFSMPNFDKKKILAKPLERSTAILTRADLNVDEENRTVELSFASDAPIYHWFGYLILDHSPSSCRLDRLNNSGALLWAHDRNLQIGSVSNTRLENGKTKATAKFSRVGLGAEKFQDVLDGICRTTSFGFNIYSIDPEVGNDGKQMMIDGEPVYRSRDWEPFEVTLEPIPADTGVGVNRNLKRDDASCCPECGGECCPECGACLAPDCEAETCTCEPQRVLQTNATQAVRELTENKTENNMPDLTENPTGQNPVTQTAVVARTAEMIQYGELFGEGELARTLVLENPQTTQVEIGQAIIAKRAASQTIIPPTAPGTVAANQGGGNIVELARSSYLGGPLKAFKGEKSLERAYKAGMSLLAALRKDDAAITFCREHGIAYNRTQSGNDNAKGGVFVIPEVESAIIDLRIEYGVARKNCQVVPMASDTKIIHRRTGGLTAYPVGAGQAGTQSTATWDDIELVARKWMVLAKIEDELQEDAVINFADTLVSEIAYAFTYAEDNALFNGDGTSTYHGIVGILSKIAAATAGLKTASGNAWSEITRQDLLGVVGLLPQFARKSGNVKWFCSHEFWANVLEVIATAAGGVTHAEMHGELVPVFFGKPVEIVEVMPHTEANSQICLLYGNMAQAATMGDRRGVTVKMTDSNDTDFEKDLETVKGTERFDQNVHDVGNTSVAGPLVGLITAGS